MIRPGAAAVLAALSTSAVLLAAAGAVVVKPVVSDGRVLATLTATEAWSIEARELLQTGAFPVTFRYHVELRRPSALWIDALLARTVVTASAKFDTLTGNYVVSRLRDGRVDKVERREQEGAVRDWLTIIDNIELEPSSPLKENTDYYVQVRLYREPRRDVSLWSVLPFTGDDTTGRAVFTYLR